MSWHSHPDASDLVRAHWHEAECFVLAQNPPCIEIRDDEITHVDRLLHGGTVDDLTAWQRPAIWMVAVLVCPGDDLTPLVHAILTQGLDPERIHFYLHPDTERQVLRPWADADLPLDRVDDAGKDGRPITDWSTLHPMLGLHLNVRILEDVRNI